MRASPKWRWLLVPAFAALALEARAQTILAQGSVNEGLASGMKVRVRTGAGLRFTGRVFSTDESSLSVVDGHGVALKFGRDQIQGIEVGLARSRGQGALRGAAWGAVAMAVVGSALYLTDRASKRDDGLCGNLEVGITTCTTGSDVAAGTIGGALIGATIGAIVPGDRWHALKPESLRLTLGGAPGGGVSVRAALSF